MTKIVIKNVRFSPECNGQATRIEGKDDAGKKIVTTNNHQTTAPIFNFPDGFFGSIEMQCEDGLFHKKNVFTKQLGGGEYELSICDDNSNRQK